MSDLTNQPAGSPGPGHVSGLALAGVLVGNLINGRREADGPTSDLIDPATGEVCGAAQVDRAVRAAQSAFPEWAATTPRNPG